MRRPDVDDHGQDGGKLRPARDDREDQATFGAGADTGPVEDGQQHQRHDGRLDQDGLERSHHNAEVDDPGQRTQGRGQKVVDQDQEATQRPRERMDGAGGDRHHAATLRIAGRDLRVLDGQQDEDD